jgi:hypothetical protein
VADLEAFVVAAKVALDMREAIPVRADLRAVDLGPISTK